MKLVMTLLVRDEIDIIRDNLDFHFAQGVDHAVVIDNGSVDGTREFLADYATRNPVTVIDKPEQNYNQSLWMTQAAFVARDTLGADWVLNNDADEFWICPSGNLKDLLTPEAPDILICDRQNLLCPWDALPESGHWSEGGHARLCDPVHLPVGKLPLDAELPVPYFCRRLPPKVLNRTRGLVKIAQGNHTADFAHEPSQARADLTIHHVTLRSAAQFRSKVENGGASYAANTELPVGTGWHWRRWYQMLHDRGLEAVLADAFPDRATLTADLEAGRAVRDDTLRTRLEATRPAPAPPDLSARKDQS